MRKLLTSISVLALEQGVRFDKLGQIPLVAEPQDAKTDKTCSCTNIAAKIYIVLEAHEVKLGV